MHLPKRVHLKNQFFGLINKFYWIIFNIYSQWNWGIFMFSYLISFLCTFTYFLQQNSLFSKNQPIRAVPNTITLLFA